MQAWESGEAETTIIRRIDELMRRARVRASASQILTLASVQVSERALHGFHVHELRLRTLDVFCTRGMSVGLMLVGGKAWKYQDEGSVEPGSGRFFGSLSVWRENDLGQGGHVGSWYKGHKA